MDLGRKESELFMFKFVESWAAASRFRPPGNRKRWQRVTVRVVMFLLVSGHSDKPLPRLTTTIFQPASSPRISTSNFCLDKLTQLIQSFTGMCAHSPPHPRPETNCRWLKSKSLYPKINHEIPIPPPDVSFPAPSRRVAHWALAGRRTSRLGRRFCGFDHSRLRGGIFGRSGRLGKWI